MAHNGNDAARVTSFGTLIKHCNEDDMPTNWARKNRGWLEEFNYVRNCVPTKYFIELLPKRLGQFVTRFGERWCIVICGDAFEEHDYFIVPFAVFKPFLVEQCLVPKGKARPEPCRWLFQVRDKSLTFFPPKEIKDEVETTKVPMRNTMQTDRH